MHLQVLKINSLFIQRSGDWKYGDCLDIVKLAVQSCEIIMKKIFDEVENVRSYLVEMEDVVADYVK